MLYRKSGESGPEALCIEHYNWQWQVKAESDLGTGLFVASVQGDCALEDCRSSKWRVYNSKKKLAIQPNVVILREKEEIFQASVCVHLTINPKPPAFHLVINQR